MTVWSKNCTVIYFMFNKYCNFVEINLFSANIVI